MLINFVNRKWKINYDKVFLSLILSLKPNSDLDIRFKLTIDHFPKVLTPSILASNLITLGRQKDGQRKMATHGDIND